MTLTDIGAPIASHLEEFQPFFKEMLRSKTALLELVIRYMTRRRGKQVRPTLVFLAAAACGETGRRSYVGAAMVELLHTATLVHDDVVDEADERRGMASINAVWKNKVAVLVGDFLLSRGLIIAVENEEFDFLRITSGAVRRLSEGELLQIQKSRQRSIDEETYFRIISDKTASLISACCEIGAISTTHDTAKHKALREYGEYVGLAFQIRDDVLDYISRSKVLGKPVANDLREKKITLPLIYACSQAAPKEAKHIINTVKSKKLTDESITSVMEFTERYGGIKYAVGRAREFADNAQKSLVALPDSAAKKSLIAFADYSISRIK